MHAGCLSRRGDMCERLWPRTPTCDALGALRKNGVCVAATSARDRVPPHTDPQRAGRHDQRWASRSAVRVCAIVGLRFSFKFLSCFVFRLNVARKLESEREDSIDQNLDMAKERRGFGAVEGEQQPLLGHIQNLRESSGDSSVHDDSPVASKSNFLGRVADLSAQSERAEPAKSSFFGSVFLVVNASIGAGLLAFPFAFQQAGGVAGAIVLQLVSVIGQAIAGRLGNRSYTRYTGGLSR